MKQEEIFALYDAIIGAEAIGYYLTAPALISKTENT